MAGNVISIRVQERREEKNWAWKWARENGGAIRLATMNLICRVVPCHLESKSNDRFSIHCHSVGVPMLLASSPPHGSSVDQSFVIIQVPRIASMSAHSRKAWKDESPTAANMVTMCNQERPAPVGDSVQHVQNAAPLPVRTRRSPGSCKPPQPVHGGVSMI